MEWRSRATYPGAHLGRGRLVEVVPRQGAAGGGREDLGAIYRELEAVRGENISPAVGLAG
jgi:hypothetical protein